MYIRKGGRDEGTEGGREGGRERGIERGCGRQGHLGGTEGVYMYMSGWEACSYL